MRASTHAAVAAAHGERQNAKIYYSIAMLTMTVLAVGLIFWGVWLGPAQQLWSAVLVALGGTLAGVVGSMAAAWLMEVASINTATSLLREETGGILSDLARKQDELIRQLMSQQQSLGERVESGLSARYLGSEPSSLKPHDHLGIFHHYSVTMHHGSPAWQKGTLEFKKRGQNRVVATTTWTTPDGGEEHYDIELAVRGSRIILAF